MTSSILFFSSGLLTMLCAVIIWRKALQRSAQPGPANSIAGIVAVSLVLNIWAIHLLDLMTESGINFTLATGTAVMVLLVQAIYCIGILRHGIQGLGLFLLPAVAVPLFLIPILPEAHTPNWVHTSSLLETGHLLISLLAFAILTLAAIHALMQIMLDNALKKKRISTLVQSLPALVDIERHMFAQVKLATTLIAVSILTGLVWQWVEYEHFALLNHKVLLALFSFGVLMLLQIKRHRASWPTSTASRTVLAAYALLMLAYFGVKTIQALLN